MLWQLVLVTSNNSASGGQLNKQTGILRQEVTGITLFGCASSRGNLSQRVTIHQGLCCSFAHMCMLSRSVVSDSLQPHGLYPTRLLCPWDSPGKNTGVGCHCLLQGIFLTQGLDSHLHFWKAGGLSITAPPGKGPVAFLVLRNTTPLAPALCHTSSGL